MKIRLSGGGNPVSLAGQFHIGKEWVEVPDSFREHCAVAKRSPNGGEARLYDIQDEAPVMARAPKGEKLPEGEAPKGEKSSKEEAPKGEK